MKAEEYLSEIILFWPKSVLMDGLNLWTFTKTREVHQWKVGSLYRIKSVQVRFSLKA